MTFSISKRASNANIACFANANTNTNSNTASRRGPFSVNNNYNNARNCHPLPYYQQQTQLLSSISTDDVTSTSSFITTSPHFMVATISTTTTTETQIQTQTQTFEAIAPDTSILVGFGVVFVLSAIAAYVWANEVVPVSRTKLALSKRDGEVKEYLDGLREGGTTSTSTRSSSSTSTSTSSSNSNSGGTTTSDANGIPPTVLATEGTGTGTVTVTGTGTGTGSGIDGITAVAMEENKVVVSDDDDDNDGRAFERWLFTNWLENNKSAGRPGRKKEPALPILKSAKWNSGDNPVLVTFALMMVGVVIASITERAGY